MLHRTDSALTLSASVVPAWTVAAKGRNRWAPGEDAPQGAGLLAAPGVCYTLKKGTSVTQRYTRGAAGANANVERSDESGWVWQGCSPRHARSGCFQSSALSAEVRGRSRNSALPRQEHEQPQHLLSVGVKATGVTDRHNRATDDRHIEATRTGL